MSISTRLSAPRRSAAVLSFSISVLALAVLSGCATRPAASDSPEALLDAAPAAAGKAAAPKTTATATAIVVAVGNVSPMPAGAVRIARLMDVPWSTLAPGSEVIVAPGAQQGPVMIDARGTAAAPITVRPSGAYGSYSVFYGFDFQHASYVKLSGALVEDSTGSAVMIRSASDHVTVSNSTLRRADIGVSINPDAGTGHQILNNLVEDSVTVGIGVDQAKASATDRSRIAGNQVLRSGHHGMEINGSNYLIEHNVTAYSGLKMGGTSGIHLLSYAGQDTGDGNIIRYNFSHHNQDPWMSDGNGIQIDQYCDNNLVAYNVTWANDGAGIIIYDGMNNVVKGNTTKANGLNSGGTHGALGEIIIDSEGPHLNRSRGNRVFDNVVLANRPDVPAIYIDYTAAPNDNVVGPNLYHHRAGGTLLQRGPQIGQTAPEIDRITGTQGNLVEAPRFVRETNPLQHGLKLAQRPSGQGSVLKDEADMIGLAATSSYSFFGAYYSETTR